MEDCGAGAAATAEAINWLGKKLVLDVDTWAKKKKPQHARHGSNLCTKREWERERELGKWFVRIIRSECSSFEAHSGIHKGICSCGRELIERRAESGSRQGKQQQLVLKFKRQPKQLPGQKLVTVMSARINHIHVHIYIYIYVGKGWIQGTRLELTSDSRQLRYPLIRGYVERG